VHRNFNSLKSVNSPITPSPRKQFQSDVVKPSPSDIIGEAEASSVGAASSKDTQSKFRRASMTIRTSNIPEVFRSLRSPSLTIGRKLSHLKLRSSDVESEAPSHDETTQEFPDHGTPHSSLNDHPSISTGSPWRPPADWERVYIPASPQHPITPSSPNLGWNPPTEWDANPATLRSLSRHRPSLPSLRTNDLIPPSSLSISDLGEFRPSPSLPSLHPVHSPSTSKFPPSSFRFEETPLSATFSSPQTPVTPYSAISLSAFPLPPQAPPFPSPYLQALPSQYMLEPEGMTPSSYVPASVRPGFPEGLRIALKELNNLEFITLKYVPVSMRAPDENLKNVDARLLQNSNQIFGSVFKDVKGLKSLKIACPSLQVNSCRSQWKGLGNLFKEVEVDVIAV